MVFWVVHLPDSEYPKYWWKLTIRNVFIPAFLAQRFTFIPLPCIFLPRGTLSEQHIGRVVTELLDIRFTF